MRAGLHVSLEAAEEASQVHTVSDDAFAVMQMWLHLLQIGDGLQHAAAFKRPLDAQMDLLQADRVMLTR